MHMKIQIYSLVLTFVLLLIPHTGTVNTKLPITLEAANAQLKEMVLPYQNMRMEK